MPKGYSIYKPLRNLLRQYNLWSGLLAAYRYISFLEYDRPLPDKLRPAGLLTKMDHWRNGLVQWEFETLIREMILNCPEQSGKRFESVRDIARCINHIKRIENDIYGAHEGEQDDVLFEMVRIAHRQFPWQTGINQAYVARYHWLYRQPGLAGHVQEIFGMNITEMTQISLSLTGHFIKNPLISRPVPNKINGVSSNVVEAYLDNLSVDLETAKTRYQEAASYDINWAYTFNVFRDRPLLRCPDGQVACLVPDFLVRRVTSGIYFDLIKIKDVGSKYLGPAVQDLIGVAIDKSNATGCFSITPESKYGTKKEPRDSIDWIVSDESAHLFVECKAARVRFKGMSDLRDREQIRKEFDRIRQFAIQAYRTIWDALQGSYPNWQPDHRPCFLAIVTLEDWQSFGLHIEREVMRPLFEDLADFGIDPDLPTKVPMTFCAIADFEAALEVARVKGIFDLFEQKKKGEYPQWALGTFVTSNYSKQLSDFVPKAFQSEWDLIDPN